MINAIQEAQWAYLLDPCFELSNSAGKPLTGGYIEVYIHGTRTKYYCASDFDGTLHPFQILLDSLGANIVLASPNSAYDVYVYNKFGSLVMSRYNVTPVRGGKGGSSFDIESTDGSVIVTEAINPDTGVKTYDLSVPTASAQASYWVGVDEAVQGHEINDTNVHVLPISQTAINHQGVGIAVNSEGKFSLKKGVYFWTVNVDLYSDNPLNTYQQVYVYSSLNRAAYKMDMTRDNMHSISFSGITTAPVDGTLEYFSIETEGQPIRATIYQASIHRLNQNVLGQGGGGGTEYTAGQYISIEDNVISVTGLQPEGDYATEEWVTSQHYATETYVDNSVTGFVNESTVTALINEAVSGKADKSEIPSLDGYATESWVTSQGYLTEMPEGYATEQWVTSQGYLTEVPEGYATESWVTSQNYATETYVDNSVSSFLNESQVTAIVESVVSGKADKSEIPSLDGYATESWVTSQGYLTTQVQSDWAATGVNEPDYIKNKPEEIPLIQGRGINIDETASGIEISCTVTSLDGYATEQFVTAYVEEMVSAVTGIGDYGEFYSTDISTGAVMSKIKGSIELTNDGKIKLKQGQSYHVTVRGRYNQTTPSNDIGSIGFVEYITSNTINVNVDNSVTGSQYFEISYDLYKLNTDVNYAVAFSGLAGKVNDLYMDIHAIGSVGVGGGGGSGVEYDQGWGIRILNNVISVNPDIIATVTGVNALIQSVTATVPSLDGYATEEWVTGQGYLKNQVQSDWTELDNTDPAYILNKPEEKFISAGNGINITESATGIRIDCTVTGGSGGGSTYTAGNNISITNDVISVTGLAQADWAVTATNNPARILNKPTEKQLVGGQGISLTSSGNTVTISAEVPTVTGFATEAQLQSVSGTLQGEIDNLPTPVEYSAGDGINITNNVISVDNTVAMASALPTTETGKFTIQSNVSGGHIQVICPTDEGFLTETVILNNDAVSGISGSTSTVYIVYKSPGYDDNYYSVNGPAVLHVPEAINGVYSILIQYAPNNNPLSSGPNLTTTIYGDSNYILAAGDYDLTAIANSALSGYGKYITIIASGPAPAAQALLKSSFSVYVSNPQMGISVKLDRYYLANNEITSTSGYTQCVVAKDTTSKKQTVYMPYSMPNSWYSSIITSLQYGSNYNSPSWIDYTTRQYRAYKYTSSPIRYQFAYLTDWDYNHSTMSFIAYDNSGNAIEKWTLNYTNYSSNVWTTTPISSGSTYTAGNGIDITNDVISVDSAAYIPYSASGVYLPNSKFEIDTEGQAYKVITPEIESNYNYFSDYGILFYAGAGTQLGTYKAILPSNVASIRISNNGGNDVTGTYDIATHTAILNVNALQGSNGTYVYAYDSNNSFVALSSSNTTVKYVVPGVTEEYITDGDLELNADNQVIAIDGYDLAVGGASSYTAGNGIDITSDVISVDNTVALKTDIPVVSGFATKTELQTVSGNIPTSIDSLVTANITDIQVVQALPGSPVATVLYLIPEA